MFWETLSGFKLCFLEANWLVMGYFKTPINEVEKKGGSQVATKSRFDLMGFINDNSLIDFDLRGVSYTWSNKKIGDALIQVKLDQMLISPEWLLCYSCFLSALTRLGSDHFLVSLSVDLFGR